MSVSRDAATAQEPGADLLSAAFLEAGFSHIAVQNTRTPAYEARRSIRSPPPLASPHTRLAAILRRRMRSSCRSSMTLSSPSPPNSHESPRRPARRKRS